MQKYVYTDAQFSVKKLNSKYCKVGSNNKTDNMLFSVALQPWLIL